MRSPVLRFCLAVCLVLFAAGAGLARGPAVRGELRSEKTQGFGRLVLTFPEPVTAAATVAGGVMIVTFDRAVSLAADRLPILLPGYVSAARLDPDQRSLRLALVQSVRADLKDAAEALYLDFLPARWRGAPPALPPAVADRLAKRLRDARALQQVATPPKAPPRAIGAVAARAVGRLRLTFPLPATIAGTADIAGRDVTIRLAGDAVFDQPAVRAALSGMVDGLEFPRETALRFAAPGNAVARALNEDGALVVDLVTPEAPQPAPVPAAPPPAVAAAPEAPPALAPMVSAAGDKVVAQGQILLSHAHPVFRITPRMPAAVFERDGAVQIVLAGTRAIRAPKVEAGERAAGIAGIVGEQHDGWSRITLSTTGQVVPHVSEDAEGWTIHLAPEPAGGTQPIRIDRAMSPAGHPQLTAALPQPADPIWLEGPEAGDRIAVVPVQGSPHAMLAQQTFMDLTLPRTALGLVVAPRADDLAVRTHLEMVLMDRPGGLILSPKPAEQADAAPRGPVFDPEIWTRDRRGSIRETERALLAAAADAPRRERTAARLRLAAFYLANGQGHDAAAVLAVTASADHKAAGSRHTQLMAGYAHALSGNDTAAATALADPAVALDAEAMLLRAAVQARLGQAGLALEAVRSRQEALERLPEGLQAFILPPVIEAALAMGDTYLAGHLVTALEQLDGTERDPGAIPYFNGRIAEVAGRPEEALAAYAVAARIGTRPVEAEARLSRALLGQSSGLLPADVARAELETVAMIWRRGPVEVRATARLAEIAAGEGRWRDAFLASRRATEIAPDHPVTRALQDTMERRFEQLFLGGESSRLSKVETLAIFDEFRALVPPGAKGDVMVRHLADRLTDLDLVPQAIELLKYQTAHRLKGAARAEAASQLALLQLAESAPQEALATLKTSRVTGLTPEVRQQRLHLEARALSELSRTELALEIVAAEEGRAVERLRADILWRAKRWGDAAQAYERSMAERWQAAEALDAAERTDVLRAAIGYVLASDRVGTDRLRAKFMPKMADSPDGDIFRLTTIDYLSRPDAFQAVARKALGARGLSDFLPAYRKRFGAG